MLGTQCVLLLFTHKGSGTEGRGCMPNSQKGVVVAPDPPYSLLGASKVPGEQGPIAAFSAPTLLQGLLPPQPKSPFRAGPGHFATPPRLLLHAAISRGLVEGLWLPVQGQGPKALPAQGFSYGQTKPRLVSRPWAGANLQEGFSRGQYALPLLFIFSQRFFPGKGARKRQERKMG